MTTTRRLFIFNTAGACFVAWAWVMGYLHKFEGHAIIPALVAVFVYGVVACFVAAHRIERATSHTMTAALVRTEHLDVVVKALFILAVIGTAIGIMNAFDSVTAESMMTPEGAREAGGKLLSGGGGAYASSLAGLSLALWMTVNARIVHTAAALRELEL